MDTINKLNPRLCRAYFQRGGKSENIISVSLVQEHFQYRLKSLEIENVREREREIATACPSCVQAMIAARVLAREGIGKAKVLKDRMFAWQETET
jgi:rhodanese-related sulfurtransferase